MGHGGFLGGKDKWVGVGHPDYEALVGKEGEALDTTIYDKIMAGSRLNANMLETGSGDPVLQTMKDSNRILEEQNEKFKDMFHLKTLPEISKKLDNLEIEINNYNTNNYSSGSGTSPINSGEYGKNDSSLITTVKKTKSSGQSFADYLGLNFY